jgi:hypothetical protein
MLCKLSITVAFGVGAIVAALPRDLQYEALQARNNTTAMSALDILTKGVAALGGKEAIMALKGVSSHA